MTSLVIILAIAATLAVERPAGPDTETMDPDQLGGDHRPAT